MNAANPTSGIILAFTLGSMTSCFAGEPSVSASALTTSRVVFGADVAGFSSGLPVLVLDTMGSGELVKDGQDHPSTLRIYPPAGDTSTFSREVQLATSTTLSVRGSSSAGFPKKSFTVDLRDQKGKKSAQPLLDLPPAETWVLVAPWHFDPGYINNAFVFAVSNRVGRWAPRTRFVEVFLNTDGGEVNRADYAGIYVLTDRIDNGENRVALSVTENSAPGSDSSYIFKIDSADADEFSWNTARGIGSVTSSLILVSPKADNVPASQRNYIRDHVQQMENALHADQAGGWVQRTHLDLIDRATWIDHHMLNTFACNPDALVRSAYFTKDRAGKIAAGPVWDFDRALGSHWDERSHRWDLWFGVGAVDVWNTGWWGTLARDPEFMQAWIDRWQTLRRSKLSDSSLAGLVSDLGRAVTAAAAARDAERWPNNVSPYGSHAAQVAYVGNWTLRRAHWIDAQFVAPPALSADGTSVTFTPPPGATLVFTLDGSDPRSVGGEIAPNAEIMTAALKVPAGANVHVRCYRAGKAGGFPGSPWSSVVATEAASPLLPRARLVNLSSRATVGTAEHAMIVGVVVTDTTSKRFLARAAGPALASFGVSGFATNPQLSVFDGVTELVGNRGWETAARASELPVHAHAVGAFPLSTGSADSALAHTIAGAGYTFHVTSERAAGTALAELYELDEQGRIANVSTRAMLRGTDRELLSGFVIRGPAYQRLLVRAVGPTLRRLGITDALAAPVLSVYSGTKIVASNDRWETATNVAAIAKAAAAVGAFNLEPQSGDSALLLTLPPGAYTAEVSGASGAEGVVLLEIYDVP